MAKGVFNNLYQLEAILNEMWCRDYTHICMRSSVCYVQQRYESIDVTNIFSINKYTFFT